MEASILPTTNTNADAITAPSSSYVLNSHALLTHLNSKRRWLNLVSLRMREAYARRAKGNSRITGVRKHETWKHDSSLPSTILESLRKDVVDALERYAQRKYHTTTRPLIVSFRSLRKVRNFKTTLEPGEYMRAGSDVVALPLYSFAKLFTPEQLKALPLEEVVKFEGHAVIQDHWRMKRLQRALRRLGGYVGVSQPVRWVVVPREEVERILRQEMELIARNENDADTEDGKSDGEDGVETLR